MSVSNELQSELNECMAFASELKASENRPNPKRKRKLAVFDLETDPFLYGRVPVPFSAGVVISGKNTGEYIYRDFWGDDCLAEMFEFLQNYPEPLKIYAHNGGKFDFVYLLRDGLLSGRPRIINNRIVEAKLAETPHLLRDSFAIIPVALSVFNKTDIDYAKMEEEIRDDHKDEILAYLKDDCYNTLELIEEFHARFPDVLTVGSLAIKKLTELHPFERISKEQDTMIRPYYFGGRVECFETGILKGDFRVYDVNSMYPHVMSNKLHPRGDMMSPVYGDSIRDVINLETMTAYNNLPFFLRFKGVNKGCLPTRTKAGLNFNVGEGVFNGCSHELQLGVKYGLIEIHEVIEALIPVDAIRFDEYVDTYIQDKIEAKQSGDKAREIFAKLLLNSAYGKTAQNPDNYFDYRIIDAGEYTSINRDNSDIITAWEDEYETVFDANTPVENYEFGEMLKLWEPAYIYDDLEIWKKRTDDEKFYDVAMGASITSAARAVLLQAILEADRPVYCDTDSIICEKLGNVDFHPSRLGAWDLEASGDTAAIAGKKLYALYDNEKCVKQATKGVKLSADEIFRLCEGETVSWSNDAPTFRLTGESHFVQRILGAEKHTKIYDQKGAKIIDEKLAS